MSIAHDRAVARNRGEVDPRLVADIRRQQNAVQAAQGLLEQLVAEALAGGAPLNDLARQTGIAKTTLIRWANR